MRVLSLAVRTLRREVSLVCLAKQWSHVNFFSSFIGNFIINIVFIVLILSGLLLLINRVLVIQVFHTTFDIRVIV